MVKSYYESLKTGENLRENLIGLKQELKNEASRQELLELVKEDDMWLTGFLQSEEPKVRKNAALILGKLKKDAYVKLLYAAYEKETQLFVKSDYLKALQELDASSCLPKLEQRLKELEDYEPKAEEQKHIREEMTALRKLVRSKKPQKKHVFTGYDETYELILTTGKVYQEITAEQIKGGKTAVLKSGVRVLTSHIKPILAIPTYRELLFLLNVRKIGPEPEQAAKELAQSNLVELLEKAHGTGTFYFRLGLPERMKNEERQRGDFARKCGFALEQMTGHKLCNSASDYEVEIRLMQNKDGSFLPMVKMFTIPDKRFAYRRNVIAASIRPEKAALIARLSRPYLKEKAQILDPFCGVGTMLIERDRLVPAGVMYGIDIFGEAIAKARENTSSYGRNIYYINRDFFDFKHEYLFDEIITNMPERGQKQKEEQDILYERFFKKAEEVLKDGGIICMYCNEKNFVKKQLRLRESFTLLQEYSMDEKDSYYLFLIRKRG